VFPGRSPEPGDQDPARRRLGRGWSCQPGGIQGAWLYDQGSPAAAESQRRQVTSRRSCFDAAQNAVRPRRPTATRASIVERYTARIVSRPHRPVSRTFILCFIAENLRPADS